MFTFDFIINPVVVLAALIGGFIVGYAINRKKLAKKVSALNKLESEMVSTHAEILETQKAYVELEKKLGEQYSPVISMKLAPGKENNSKEKFSK